MNTNYVQAICSICKDPIVLGENGTIHGGAVCYPCYSDHRITMNVCPCPYKEPRSRRLVDRSPKKFHSLTTVASTQGEIGRFQIMGGTN